MPSLIDAVEPKKINFKERINFPQKNKFFENQEEVSIKFVKIISNYNHSAAIDHMGHLWTWGSNLEYSLGHMVEEDIPLPTKIDFFKGLLIFYFMNIFLLM